MATDVQPVSQTNGAEGPAAQYASELRAIEQQQARARRISRILGISKLLLAAFTVIAAGFLIRQLTALWWLLIPVVAFIVLAAAHERVLKQISYHQRAQRFYESGLARLRDEWRGRGERGDRFLEATHPYARDLDVFGEASLFQYLSTARTRTGEETLAHWLLVAAPLDEIANRQAAVRDLSTRLKFRERLAAEGEWVRSGIHPETLAAWGGAPPVLTNTATRVTATLLALLWVAAIIAWPLWDWPLPALLMTLANFAYAHRLASRLDRAAASIEKAAGELRLLAEILALMEAEKFVAPKLVALQQAVERTGTPAWHAIRKLAGLAELIESRHSLFARPLDLVTFWSAQLVFAAERWQKRFGPEIRGWLAAVGELEALSSLATFSFERPQYAFPEFLAAGPCFDAKALAHPLLGNAVANDVRLDDACQLIILSGPNMAGKSTFIRALGVNAVLAQCGAPVRAAAMRMSPLRVAASICILDSLRGGVSRFYAEIRRVKMIVDLAQDETPVLFLLDELLSGTNSHDRLVGTQFVLQQLVERKAIGVVSTHDLALAQIPESMHGRACNAHFEDRVEGDALVFDYKLKPGVVKTSNALKLMRGIGLGVAE